MDYVITPLNTALVWQGIIISSNVSNDRMPLNGPTEAAKEIS